MCISVCVALPDATEDVSCQLSWTASYYEEALTISALSRFWQRITKNIAVKGKNNHRHNRNHTHSVRGGQDQETNFLAWCAGNSIRHIPRLGKHRRRAHASTAASIKNVSATHRPDKEGTRRPPPQRNAAVPSPLSCNTRERWAGWPPWPWRGYSAGSRPARSCGAKRRERRPQHAT